MTDQLSPAEQALREAARDYHRLPTPGKGYKIGLDYGAEEAWDPEADAWPVRLEEEAENASWVAAHAPGLAADGPHLSECCPWTLTPDNEYFIDRRGADRKSTRLNSSHVKRSRMPSSA